MEDFKEFIHFGLTSQDINNTAIPLSIKEAMEKNYLPHLKKILKDLEGKSKRVEKGCHVSQNAWTSSISN